MMRTHKVRTLMAAAALCCIGLFTTCKNTVGLGGTVDINPPTLDVSTIYPPAGAVIRDTFVLSIEAKDDSGIASVTANLTKTGLTEQPDSKYTSYSLEKAADGTHWTAHINKKDTEKGFPLTDGSYKVLLTATDTVGKTARTESTFTIDNTAPLLILNRPSTTTNDDSSDMFGDGFLLVGQVYDDTPVAALTVTAKGTGEHDAVFTKSIAHVPQNIRLTVDAFSSDSMKKFYQGLYGSNQNAGPKSYTYNITVEDEAKVYQAPGDKGSGSGNTTNRYYLFDELYSEVLSEYRIQTVYNMMRGTYSSQTEVGVPRSAAEIEADQKKTAAVQAALQKAQLGGNVKRQGTFSLNPSLNPRFDIAGEIPVARPEAGGAPKFSRLYSGSTLTVKVSSNLDGVPLESADSYRFFLMEWQKFADFAGGLAYPTDKINGDSIYADAGRTTVKPEFIELTKSKVEKEGSSYIFSVPVSAEDSGLTYGKSYVLLVRGKDQGGKNKQPNELIPDFKGVRGGVYGFSLVKTGKAPEVFVTQINDTVGTGADGSITERVYLKKGDSLKFKIKLQPITARVTYTLQGDLGGNVSEAQTYTAGEHDVTIDKAKFNQDADGTYKLTVKAEADEGSSLEQTYHIVYDVKGPEVRIAYPVGNLFGDDGTSLVIKGTAFDTGSGLAEHPVTVSLTATDGGPAPAVMLVENGENWTSQSISLPEGKYTLTVTAKDKLGQQGSAEPLIFIYDKADPDIQAVKLIEIDSSNIEVKTHTDTRDTVYSKHTKVKVTGNIVETYGLASFTIDDVPITPIPDSSFSWDTSLSEGSHDIEIKAKDKAGKDGSYTVKVVVDITPPAFEHLKFANVDASSALITTSENPIKITGTIKDSVSGKTVSGVKEVYYAVTANTASAPADTSTDWKQLNGKFDNNSIDYILNGFVEINSNDEQKLHIKAVDNAGNKKLFEQKVKVVPAAVIAWNLELKNNTSPSGTVKYNAGQWYAKGQFKVKIGGTSNPVPTDDTIDVKIKKKDASDIIVPTDFFDNWTGNEPKITISGALKEYTVKSGLDDGTYTITIKASNHQEQSLEFTIDGTSPTITPASSGDGALPADNAWVNTKALSVSGTAADAISGIEKIEAIVNSGTPKLLGTESPWSGYLTLAEGDNTVQFRVTDKAGNYTETASRTIKVDTGRPTIGLTHGATEHVNKEATGQFTVNVTVGDAAPADSPTGTTFSGLKEIQYSTNASFPSGFSTKTVTANGAETIALSGLTATTTYYFRAVDKAGNQSEIKQLNLFVDAQDPEVSFGEYTPKVVKGSQTYTNKKVKVQGTARDNDAVKKVTITATGTKSGNTSVTNHPVQTFTNAAASSWSFDFNTADYKDNTAVTLTAVAEDNSGNTKSTTLVLHINQDTDSPRVRIKNINTPASSDSTNPTVLVQKTELEGTVLDDDGTVQKIEIAKDAAFTTGKKEFTAANAGFPNWKYDGLPTDGNVQLYFRITDKEGNVFTSSNSSSDTRPVLYTVNEQGMESTVETREPLALRTDSTRPSIAAQHIKVMPVGGSSLETLSGVQYRKASDRLTLEVPVFDSSGIKSLTATIEGTAITKSANHTTNKSSDLPLHGNTYQFWAFNEDGANIIPFTSLSSGNYVLKLEATDNNGLTSRTNIIITVDDTKPTVALSSYTAQELNPSIPDTMIVKKQLGGKVLFIGSFSDGADGSGIAPATVQLAIGRDEKLNLGTGGTSAEVGGVTAEAGSATWQLVCENICEVGEKYTDYANKDSDGHFIKYNKDTNEKLFYNGTPNSDYAKSKIYEVPLIVTVSDRAGNTKKQTYLLLVDSDGAAPDVKVTAPQHTTTTDTDPEKAYKGYTVPTMGNSTIVFSGTAQPKIIAGNNKVTTIQVRFSEAPDFTQSFKSKPAAMLPGETSIAAVEWKDGVKIIKDITKNHDTWRFEIDGDHFLTNDGTKEPKRTLFYQVRGLYEDAGAEPKSIGEWSETRKLIIDQNAPSFSAVCINTTANGYEVNKRVKTGDIVYLKALCQTDIASIELSSTTQSLETGGKPTALNKTYSKTASNTEYKLTSLAPDSSTSGTQLSNGWTRWNEGGQKGYTIPIRLDVTQLNDPNDILTLTVKLTTKKTDGDIPNTQVFVFKYDKYTPQVVFGTVVGKFGKATFGATQVVVPKDGLPATAENLYIFVRGNDETEKAAHEIKVTNVDKDTGIISYDDLTLSGLHQKLSGECLYVLFKKTPAVFNQNGSYQIQGIAQDRGTGVDDDNGKVVARIFKAGVAPFDGAVTADCKEVMMTRDGGDDNKVIGQLGTFVTFKGSLDVSQLGDGETKLWITAYDGADNASPKKEETVYLRNNPIAVVKMYFQTDLDKDNAYTTPGESYAVAGNPKVETEGSAGNETNNFKNLYDAGFVYRQKDLDSTSSFTFKNRKNSALKVEFVGGVGTGHSGNSTYSYKLYKEKAEASHLVTKGEKTDVTQASVTHAATKDHLKANPSGFASFDIPLGGKFGTGDTLLNEGNTDLILQLFDAVTNDSGRYAEVQMKVAAKLTDGRLPQAVMLPFYWNSKADNSLKDNSTEKGHIELATPNPSVSGAVVLRGFAYHPAFVQSIKLSGAGINASISYGSVDATGKWNPSSATSGFTAKTTHLSKEGHWVQWEYVWDTPAPALNQDITVQVESIAETAAFVVQGTPSAATGIIVEAGAAKHIAAATGQEISFTKEDGSAVGTTTTIGSVTEASGDKTITWTGSLNLTDAKIAQIHVVSPAGNITPTAPAWGHLDVSSVTATGGTLPATTAVTAGQFIRLTDAVGSSDGEQSYLVSATANSSGGKTDWKAAISSVPKTTTLSRAYLYPIGYDANLKPVYNKPTMSVNVVPYITALKREKKYNTHRSSSGAYNIMRKDPNAVSTNPNTGLVIVTGFNLMGTVTATIPGVAVPQSVSKTGDVLTFIVPNAAKSGPVTINANAIDAINNQTNNSKEYNKQNKPNRPETDLWTDDIAIDVWDDDTTANEFKGSTNPAYPSMARGSNGDLYAAFSNYSTSKVYYSKIPTSGAATVTEVFYTYDPPEEACISVSSDDKVNVLYSANYHGGSESAWVNDAEKAGGLYCYDENASSIYVGRDYRKVHRFELFYHNKQLQQFKNFRIARGNNNRIHIAYYDTLSHSIKYATVMNNAQGNDLHERPWVNLDGGSDSHDTGSYTGGSSLVLPDGNTNFENGLNRTGSTASYCAIALDKLNRPVVVYADVDTGTLRLARANAETPTAAANWKVQKVLPSSDDNEGLASDYFAAQFDSAGYLHIVFRSTKGQLCYVKSKEKNQGANPYTFDKSVVIAENGSWVELTMDGTTPYVAYLSKTNAYDGIQIAYYDANLVKKWKTDGSGDEKGAWNIMTAAMQNRSGAARACVAVAPSVVTDWKAAVGYTPGDKYRVVKYIGK